jgi:hypothetical protein
MASLRGIGPCYRRERAVLVKTFTAAALAKPAKNIRTFVSELLKTRQFQCLEMVAVSWMRL